MASAESKPKKKSLNIWMATALVMGTMIGSGVFLLPASLAPYGGIALLGWVVTSVGAILLALVFGKLAQISPATGGPYAYTRMGFDDFTGYLVGWGYWIALWVGNAGIAVAMIGYLGVFFPALNQTPALGAGVAIATVWLLTWVNISGVRNAGIVQLVTTVLKIIPLVAVAFFGLFYLNPENFTPFNASGESPMIAIAATAALTLWPYLGLESATVLADDVEDAKKTIPRATILGVSLTAVIYILGTTSVMGLIPSDALAASSAPYADAAEAMWGRGAGLFVAFGTVASTFGAMNGWLLLQGQVPMAETASPSPAADWWHPSSGLTWQWQLGSALDFDLRVDVWDIDLGVHKSVVDKLHSLDAKVICYISVGSHENWRTDADQFPDEVLGNKM